jgi:hypothetical protein
MSIPDRRVRLDRTHGALSIRRQCRLLGLARSGVYRTPAPASGDDLGLMRRIDELFTAWPFLGSRRMARLLTDDGHAVNRKRVQRLMRLMGIAALGPKPRTSKPTPGHRIFPYLLRDMTIDQPNQVWAADITYIPVGRGFLYLVAIMDWASRAVLSWRLSETIGNSLYEGRNDAANLSTPAIDIAPAFANLGLGSGLETIVAAPGANYDRTQPVVDAGTVINLPQTPAVSVLLMKPQSVLTPASLPHLATSSAAQNCLDTCRREQHRGSLRSMRSACGRPMHF